MKETDIVRDCLQYLQYRGIMSWRQNTTGIFNAKSGGYYFHGRKGVSDILGVFPQTVEIEGKKVVQGLFLAIEVKMPKKNPTPDQHKFLDEINSKGGIGICVHSVEELDDLLEVYL